MKRIIALLTCIMMIVGIFPQTSFAATVSTELPADAVIAGGKIYTRNYMSNNLNEVNTEIRNNPGRVFYIDKDKNIKDEQGNTVTEQQIVEKNIRMLTLYSSTSDAQANGTKYVADEDGYFKKIEPSQTSYRYGYTVLDVEFVENTMNKKIINVSVKELNYVPDAYFYFVSKDNIWSYKKLSEVPGSAQLNKKNLNDMFSLANVDYLENLYICFYNSAGDLVAKGVVERITSSSNARPVLLYIEYPKDLTASRLTGNISNNGIVATDGDFIYYSNSADGGKIYKKSIDGYEDYPICNDNAKYINVVGDFIYYSNMSDGGKIYRIKTDGTSRSKINNVLSSYINVVNDDIYYVNGKRGNKIYKLKAYNTDPQNEGTLITTDKAQYLVATDDGKTLYYSNLSDKGRLYSINVSTGTRKGYATSDGNTNRGVKYLSISSGGILYASGYDGKLYRLEGERLYPITIQTTITKKGKNTAPQIVNDKVGFINAVDENSIYYKSTADSGKIYKFNSTINSTTGTSEKVVDDTATCVNVVGDYIFYLKGSKLYIYDIKLQNKPIAAAKFKPEGKIVKVDDLDQIPYGSPLPERISVIMDDGSVKDVLVTWDTKNVKGKNGIYTYKGTVIGYGTKVQISAARYSPTIDEKNIFVFNEDGPKADSVVVKGLNQGDEVNIYNADDKLLGKAKADKTGTATLAKIDLDSAGGIIKVTRTIPGYTPSNPVTKLYDAEAPSIIKVEYIASNDAYRVTYRGLSEKISYALEKVISDTVKETIVSEQNKTATSLGSGMYYFDFKDEKDINNIKGISESDNFNITQNINLTIKYQNTKTQTTSKSYTLLAQSTPNITYNIALGTFTGTLSNVEVQIPNNTTWRSIQDVITDKTLLVGKYYISARYKPIGNKLPGQTKYVPLIQLPNLAIKTKPIKTGLEKEDILNTNNELTYVYDATKNEFNAKFVLNKKESGIYIEVSDIDSNLETKIKFNNNEYTTTTAAIDYDKIGDKNVVTLEVKGKDSGKLLVTQTFNFKAIDVGLELKDIKIDGMYAGGDGSSDQKPYTIHSGSFTAPILSGLGSSAPVYGQIKSTTGSSISIDYNLLDFTTTPNGGIWVGEKISPDNPKYQALYDGNTYKLELNYVSKDIRPSISSNKKEVYFKLSNETVPVVKIKDLDGKEIGINKTIYGINGVLLNDYLVATSDTIKWVDSNKDLVQDPNNYKYSFCVEYKPFYMDDFVPKKKDDKLTTSGQLKVTVRNNENGYVQDFYYNFIMADYTSNLYIKYVDLILDDGSVISEELDSNSTIKLKKYLSEYGSKKIEKVKFRFNTVVDEIKDKNGTSILTNINSDIAEINASSILINKELNNISTAGETIELKVTFKTSATNFKEETIKFTLDPSN